MNEYQVEGVFYDKANEAKAAARKALIGRHHDDYVLVLRMMTWVDPPVYLPVYRAEFRGDKIICK